MSDDRLFTILQGAVVEYAVEFRDIGGRPSWAHFDRVWMTRWEMRFLQERDLATSVANCVHNPHLGSGIASKSLSFSFRFLRCWQFLTLPSGRPTIRIDWTTGTLTAWSPPAPPVAFILRSPLVPPGLTLFWPTNQPDLREMFSLLPHRPYDCAIYLHLWAPLPSCRLYFY